MPKVINTGYNSYRAPYTIGTAAPTPPSTYNFNSSSNVLWRFNETDTTQIGARIIPCTLNATPISSETITVVSGGNSVGTRLRFQLTFGTASSSTNAGAWPILDDSGNVFTLPDRFVFRCRFASLTTVAMTNLFFGFGVYNGDSTGAGSYGIGIAQHSTGGATVITRLQGSDAASTTRPWNAMSTTGPGGVWQAANNVDHAGSAYQIKFNMTQGSGGNPFVGNATYESIAGGAKSDQTPFTLIPAARSAAGAAFQTITTTIDAGWNNQVCNYPMFFVLAQTGIGAKTADFEIADAELLVDPMDYP